LRSLRFYDTALDLITLYGFKQSFKISFPKTIIFFVLGEFKKYGTNHFFGKICKNRGERFWLLTRLIKYRIFLNPQWVPHGRVNGYLIIGFGGGVMKFTPLAFKRYQLSSKFLVANTICWMPSLLKAIKNSLIWPVPTDASAFNGIRI